MCPGGISCGGSPGCRQPRIPVSLGICSEQGPPEVNCLRTATDSHVCIKNEVRSHDLLTKASTLDFEWLQPLQGEFQNPQRRSLLLGQRSSHDTWDKCALLKKCKCSCCFALPSPKFPVTRSFQGVLLESLVLFSWPRVSSFCPGFSCKSAELGIPTDLYRDKSTCFFSLKLLCLNPVHIFIQQESIF